VAAINGEQCFSPHLHPSARAEEPRYGQSFKHGPDHKTDGEIEEGRGDGGPVAGFFERSAIHAWSPLPSQRPRQGGRRSD